MKSDPRYIDGKKNKAIRYYFYIQQGLVLFNEFRFLIMAIFAIYYTLKLESPLLLLVMFVVSVPILGALGYFQLHHMAKVIEYLKINFATHWNKRNFELNEERNEILKDIKEKI